MIDPKFIINLKGKDFPTWPGILDAATRNGLRSLTTVVVQIPSAENGGMAVVMARAEFEDGRVFEDVGDASPANCGPQIATAALRMASTRAKGRCLRDALSIGATMYEELPPDTDRHEPLPTYTKPIAVNGKDGPRDCDECGCELTAAQTTYSLRRYGQALCPEHQKTASAV